ncbi:MAG: ShlB/FhaC/HecB family hemolysin secretion/activation protein [Thiobacillus sp.]|nr:ShlB/FhaC/HecB family hemolysin secretion/activation protein [Thiobacillus sp.]
MALPAGAMEKHATDKTMNWNHGLTPPAKGAHPHRVWAWGALLALLSATAQAEETGFDILEFVVEGNTVLPAQHIEEAVYPFMGEKKGIGEADAARTALEKAYHDNGYLTVFVDIPEQEVKSGVVRLRVTEGQVERLRVTGSRYYSLGRIRAKAPDLAEGSVPYFPEVQKQLAGVNKGADRRVTPVLRPGRTPGKVEVDLKVEDQLPLHGSVELNDRYSANTTKSRLNANLRYDNLWQQEHSLTLGLQTAPEDTDESKVLSATYVWPMANGNYLAAYGVLSESDVASVGDVNVVGNGLIAGLRYILPLRSRPGYFHTLTLGMDFKDFDETVKLQGTDSANTPISYLPFSLGYEGNLRSDQSQTQFNATLNFSLRGLADGEVECLPGIFVNEFACKRFLGRANYAYLRLDLKHTRTFPSGWSLFGRGTAQVASSPLISNEQFSAGGVDSVRGYTESVVSGDQGLAWGLEMRAPSLAQRLSPRLEEFNLYAFVEGASLSIHDPLPAQTDQFDLLAAGLGLRFKGWGGFYGHLDWAHPYEDAGPVLAGEDRFHLRLGYAW